MHLLTHTVQKRKKEIPFENKPLILGTLLGPCKAEGMKGPAGG